MPAVVCGYRIRADPTRPAATRSSSSTSFSRSSSTASSSSTRTSASRSPGRRLDQVLTPCPPQDRPRGPEGAGRPRPRRRAVRLRAHGRLRRREARDGGLPLLEDWVRPLSASQRDQSIVSLTRGHEGRYWSKHLRGRPYHISALYVVDLDRFRQVAAGDLLRQQYQALSADPGSLANLDQDLPNNMNPNLPIVRDFF